MLTVIAVIGIMCAIGVAFFGGEHREQMHRVRDQRNAQEIASLAMGASAAGAPVVAEGDMRTTILSEPEIEGALRYLSWHDGMVSYTHGH